MPSERRGTVTDDFVGYMRRLQGSTEWKGDQAGTVRAAIAKVCQIVSCLETRDGC
jgi:large subunit ribosomal protein L1